MLTCTCVNVTWVAMPTGQVLRWHFLIMVQPSVMRGAVENPYSSAPSMAATTTSRPVTQSHRNWLGSSLPQTYFTWIEHGIFHVNQHENISHEIYMKLLKYISHLLLNARVMWKFSSDFHMGQISLYLYIVHAFCCTVKNDPFEKLLCTDT